MVSWPLATFQISNVPSFGFDDAPPSNSVDPSGENETALTPVEYVGSDKFSDPVEAFQRLRLVPPPAASSWPFGEKATDVAPVYQFVYNVLREEVAQALRTP